MPIESNRESSKFSKQLDSIDAPSFSRRESERSIFRPDKIVLPARESFQKVKTRRYRDARFWKPAVNVTVYLGRQLLTFQIFPNYRKLIRYLLLLLLLLEPKSKVLSFSYFFLFIPAGREFSCHLNSKQPLSPRLKFYSLQNKFFVSNLGERVKIFQVSGLFTSILNLYCSKWRGCTTRDKCPFTPVSGQEIRGKRRRAIQARIITWKLVSYSFSTLFCLPFLRTHAIRAKTLEINYKLYPAT